jgi:hypothetical protein
VIVIAFKGQVDVLEVLARCGRRSYQGAQKLINPGCVASLYLFALDDE